MRNLTASERNLSRQTEQRGTNLWTNLNIKYIKNTTNSSKESLLRYVTWRLQWGKSESPITTPDNSDDNKGNKMMMVIRVINNGQVKKNSNKR